MSFKLGTSNNRAILINEDNYYDLEEISNGYLSSDSVQALASIDEINKLSSNLGEMSPTGKLSDIELGNPVPNSRNSYAVGLNYKGHAEEGGMQIPEVPMVFTKHTSCFVGPNANVEMRSDFVDYEAELVVVVGKEGKDIKKEEKIPFWSEDPNILFQQKYIFEFYPVNSMSYEQKLNTITRLVLLLILLSYLYSGNIRILVIGIITVFAIFLMLSVSPNRSANLFEKKSLKIVFNCDFPRCCCIVTKYSEASKFGRRFISIASPFFQKEDICKMAGPLNPLWVIRIFSLKLVPL